ncbi:MauE/DoxX family redox-associated membrane protein [Microbacterium sp. SA39]|uniref:MauE/DoxX family redox-associated membrane protein n=1 Tax=Microbacterium sp. SA39 TaxID=1263625 RepID=UPI0005FA2D1A|nr:MauE/DoxX family redox-associated membrane protein [Microbacterium sp. SA39]KJQ55073.1 hypothetical protein RS85_01132 [Microbacterium sp. SA39]
MMVFLVPLPVLLAVVFALSVIGKLRAADRGSAAFDALRIPVRHPDAAAKALIAFETVVALGLVVTSGIVYVAFTLAAVALTAGLLIVVVRAHRLGVTDDCGCFGDLLPARIGPRLIVRNVALTVSALAAFGAAFFMWGIAGVRVGLPDILAYEPWAEVALWTLAGSLPIAVTTWSIARAAVPAAPASPPDARGAGAVVLPASGEVLDLLAAGARARIVVFVSPGCHACETALSSIRAVHEPLDSVVDLFIVQRAVSGSTGIESAHALPRTARFALDIGGSLGAQLDIGVGTPVAALIGTDGFQAGPLAVGSEEIAQLVASILALAEAAPS